MVDVQWLAPNGEANSTPASSEPLTNVTRLVAKGMAAPQMGVQGMTNMHGAMGSPGMKRAADANSGGMKRQRIAGPSSFSPSPTQQQQQAMSQMNAGVAMGRPNAAGNHATMGGNTMGGSMGWQMTGGPMMGRQMDGGNSVLTVQIPDSKAGLVIGKGGATIKEIQHSTGTHLKLPNEADAGSDPPVRTITISGANPEVAKMKILNIVGQERMGSSVLTVQIEDSKAGLVIGRGGATIKEIQSRTGTHIELPNQADEGSKPPVRTITITKGFDTEAQQAAKMSILSLVGTNGGSSVLTVQIEDSKAGLVIGKGGVTIKEIQARTGTHIELPNQADEGSSPPVRTVTITRGNHPGAQQMAR